MSEPYRYTVYDETVASNVVKKGNVDRHIALIYTVEARERGRLAGLDLVAATDEVLSMFGVIGMFYGTTEIKRGLPASGRPPFIPAPKCGSYVIA